MATYRRTSPVEIRERLQRRSEQLESVRALREYQKYIDGQKALEEQQKKEQRKQEEARQAQAKDGNFIEGALHTVGDVGANLLTGIGKGVEGIVDFGIGLVGGIGGLFSSDFKEGAKAAVAHDFVGETLGANAAQERLDQSWINDTIVEDVVQGVGQMLPSVALTVATGGTSLAAQAAGMAVMGISAAGNATEEAYNDGAGYYEGLGYGVARGATEALTEKIGGHVLGEGASLVGKAMAGKAIGRATSKGLGKVAYNFLSEGAEEVLSDALDPATKSIYKGKEAFEEYTDPTKRAALLKQLGRTFVVGGTVGSVMEGGQTLVKNARNSNRGGAQATQADEMLSHISEVSKSYGKDESANARYDTEIKTSIDEASKNIKKMSEEQRGKYLESLQGTPYRLMFDSEGNVAAKEGGSYNAEALSVSLKQVSGNLKHAPTQAEVSESAMKMKDALEDIIGDRAHVVISDSMKTSADGTQGTRAFLDPETGVFYVNNKFKFDEKFTELATAIHELYHAAEGTKQSAELHRALGEFVQAFPEVSDALTGGIGETITNDLIEYKDKKYNAAQQSYVYATEIDADILGKLLGSEEYVAKLAARNENLVKKLYTYLKAAGESTQSKQVRRALNKLTKKFGNALDHAKGGVLVSQIGDEEEKENTVTSINEENMQDTVNESVDSDLDLRYNKTKYNRTIPFLHKNFPPENETHSEAHRLAVWWARRSDVEVGDQTLISMHGRWYLVEKFEDATNYYQVEAFVPKAEYNIIIKEIKEHGRSGKIKSIQESTDFIDKLYKSSDTLERGKSGVDGNKAGHGRKDYKIQRVDQIETARRERSSSYGSGDSKSSGADRQGNNINDRRSYAGVRADTADHSLLSKAQEMLDEGYDSETVRKETGWFKGYDGKWRFEIDDSSMEFSRFGFNPDYLRYKELELKFIEGNITDQELKELQSIPEDIKSIKLYRLDQFIKHDELFAAYPELRRMRVTFEHIDSYGAFYPNTFSIKIDPQAPDISSTLIHEIQHAIQHTEGFTSGTEIKPVSSEVKNRLYILKEEQKKVSKELEEIYSEIGFHEYSDSLWEKAWNMEIDPDSVERLESEFLAEKSRKGYLLYGYQKQLFEMMKDTMQEESAPREEYMKTAGEIEARDVQKRLHLDETQRKNTRPDIDQEDVVFAESSDKSLSIFVTENGKPVVVVNDDITRYASNDKDLIKLVKQSIGKLPYVALGKQKIKFTYDTKGEVTFSKYTRWIRANAQDVYKDKMRLFNHPSEIILATTNYINEGLSHPRTDNIIDFARGELLVDILGNQYSAEVVIGFTKAGECELHDVVKMVPASFKYKTRDALSVISLSNEHPQKRSSLNNSIPQNSDLSTKKSNINDRSSKTGKDTIEMSKGEVEKLRANYQSEKVFDKKGVSDALNGITMFKKLPSDVRGELIKSIWTGFNEHGAYDRYIEVTTERLYATIMQETDFELYELDVKESKDAEMQLKDEIKLALQNIVDDADESTLSKMRKKAYAEVEDEIKALKAERDKLKKKNDENDAWAKSLTSLLRKIKTLEDKNSGKYVSASQYNLSTFKGAVKALGKVIWRGDINVTSARKHIATLSEWYGEIDKDTHQPKNTMLAGIYSEDVAQSLKDIATEKGKLTVEELDKIRDIADHFIFVLENDKKVFLNGKYEDAPAKAKEFVKLIQSNAGKDIGALRMFWNTYLEYCGDPMMIFRRMDKYKRGFWTTMGEELRAAAAGAAIFEMETRAPIEEFLSKHKKFLNDLEGKTVTYNGTEIPLGIGMNLYCTLKREQAQRGLMLDGISFEVNDKEVNIKGLIAKEVENGDADQLKEILAKAALAQDELYKQFSAEQKEYIKLVEKALNEDCKNAKQETDKKRFGISNVIKGFYWPIKRANTAKTVDMFTEMDRVSTVGFNKDTVKGARGVLRIESIDSVVNRHIKAVSMYSNLATVIDSYNVLYNMDISGNPNDPVSVSTQSRRVGWKKGNEYVQKLLSDIQEVPSGSNGFFNRGLNKLRGTWAKFQLGLNLKVIVTQTSSFVAATNILDPDCVAKGMTVDAKDVYEYSKLAKHRGHENVAAQAQGLIEKTGKLSDAFMQPIGWMDSFVVKRLFGACQLQIQREQGLVLGSKENKIAAGKLLDTVIFETQQNAFASERSAAMRSGETVSMTLTMFTSDSMKLIGRVIDAVGEVGSIKAELNVAKDPAERATLEKRMASAQKQAVRSVSVLVSQAVFMALVAQLFRTLYAKDDEDDNIPLNMTVDMVGNLIGGLPLVKDVYAYFAQGYELDIYAYSAFNGILDSAKSIMSLAGDFASGDWDDQKMASAIKKLAFSAGEFTGLPTRNVYNFIYGITKRVSPSTAYKFDNLFYNQSYRADLAEAVEKGDEKMISVIAELALNDAVGKIEDEKTVRTMVSLSKLGYDIIPRGIGDTATVNKVSYALNGKQKKTIEDSYGQANKDIKALVSSKVFNTMSAEIQAKAINYIYDTYYNKGLSEALEVEIDNKMLLFSQAFEISDLALIIAYCRAIAGDVDADGKTISGSKKTKVAAYIESLKLTAAQKYMIMGYLGYKNKKGEAVVRKYIQSLRLTKEQKEKLFEESGY